MKMKSYCKINIGLCVERRREDGYHQLQTVMYPVRELFDDVCVERAAVTEFVNEGIAVDCPADKNICLKALQLMQQRYGVGAARIVLRKRVPFGAGLGGGSSDGTMTLVALNEIFALDLSEAELIAAAAELGSDTAFFVRNAPQLCTARGEVMQPIVLPQLSGKWLVVVKPDGESVSTREAYSGIMPHMPAVGLSELLARPIEQWRDTVVNDFEPHIFAAHPRIAALKEALYAAGVVYASMSGSGSAVFGIFDTEPSTERVAALSVGAFVHIERIG